MSYQHHTPGLVFEPIEALFNSMGVNFNDLTPMMAQYAQIKRQFPQTIVMFRMGDFYEVFFSDAKICSQILNITLTHRGKLAGEHPIPMAGIPHHAASSYIDKLTDAGLKVAICEQTEDPKLAKGIVKREVTQVVSPSLPYDLDKKNDQIQHFIGSGWYNEKNEFFYLVLIDYVTGDFIISINKDENEFIEILTKISPKEFIIYHNQWDNFSLIHNELNSLRYLITYLGKDHFNTKFISPYLEKVIPHYLQDQYFRPYPQLELAIGIIGFYLCTTQSQDKIEHLKSPKLVTSIGLMKVSHATLTGLEILPRQQQDHVKSTNSLLQFMNQTQSSLGSRKLRDIFLNPLTNLEEINLRQNTIEIFLNHTDSLDLIRHQLGLIRDLDKLMTKAATHRASSGDLLMIADTIMVTKEIKNILDPIKEKFCLFTFITKENFSNLEALSKEIDKTLNRELGATLEKGNYLNQEVDEQRDHWYKLAFGAQGEIKKLEEKLRADFGITTLKIKHNNISGYFIEVSKSHLSKVPDHFKRRQTLVNCELFQCEELKNLEIEVQLAKERLYEREYEIFQNLLESVKKQFSFLQSLSQELALLDVLSTFSIIAYQQNFTRPILHNSKQILKLQQAWHPLIKAAQFSQFVPHDLELNSTNFFALITGPNMAGKTTVMREIAIIQFLAQIGCFVPAQKAELGICEFLFSRLGAHDDITKGQSTFMVEMVETAQILRHANEKSLILLDEIGRGTSTYDGLSLAWSLTEYLHDKIKSLILFSTHYHELIELADKLPGAKNFTIKIKKEKDRIHFLYELIEGGAQQSFGLEVAKLAGLPDSVIQRAQDILGSLEKNSEKNQNSEKKTKILIPKKKLKDPEQLQLF